MSQKKARKRKERDKAEQQTKSAEARCIEFLGLTFARRNGQNLGFPLLPYLSKCAPFLRAFIACCKSQSDPKLLQPGKQSTQKYKP